MEKFMERQVATINTIEDRINGHKNFLMNKKRIRYSYKQIVEAKLAQLRPMVFDYASPCDNWEKREAYYRGVGEYDYIDADYVPFCVGDEWGGPDVTCFFRKEIEIPKELDGKKVELQFYVGGDSLVSVNGKHIQGLDPFRNSFLLTDKATAGEKFLVEVESFCFYATPVEGVNKRKLECSSLTVTNKEINDIYWDFRVALNLLDIKDISADLSEYVEQTFHDILNLIDTDTDDKALFMDKLRKADEIVRSRIFESGKFHMDGVIDLVAHSHLDVVYMWDYKEFIRKTGRTHATMLALLDEFPEFKFSQSQAVTYMEIKNNFPDVYERIKEYVKAGRWEIIGAMWVEPDCNLPSGESFVRQILEGKKFFKKEFGITPQTAWLPDVFGNSYAMPQILAKAGIKYFVTHKPAVWNDTNPINHNTFWWQGADGSRVLAVIPPSHFVGTCEPAHIMLNWANLSDKSKIKESIYCYGWGDGGGGVSVDMIENAMRMKKIVGMPDTRIINAEDALKDIAEKAEQLELPVLQSEIYLEAHRAVPTIRTEIKKYNRRLERLLHDAELYSVMAEDYGYKYDFEKLEAFSRMILTNQFHDTLPGTHVADAYTDIIKSYEEAALLGESIRDDALRTLAAEIKYDKSRGTAIAVFNPLPYAVTKAVSLGSAEYCVEDSDGARVPAQMVRNLNGADELKFIAKDIPAFGFKVFYLTEGTASAQSCAVIDGNSMENSYFRISFNSEGDISSIFDKRNNREIVAGYANRLCMFEDVPSNHDAWDIVPEHRECEVTLSAGKVEEYENGAVQASVLLTKKCLNSTVWQKITLYSDIDIIDFETKVDWNERQKNLRTDFMLDVVTDKYTTNLAYASLERPTNAYNTYDEAKFEVCAQDFIDMSEEGYGVSILSDTKNAYNVNNNRISLSLLKSPIYPDEMCDRGINEFKYSLYPHNGTWKNGQTVQKFGASAGEAQVEYLTADGNAEGSYAVCDSENVIIEAVKKAEDGNGIIIRVLEKYGRRTNAVISFKNALKSAQECNLMEDYTAEAEVDNTDLKFSIKPYEIKTFRIIKK